MRIILEDPEPLDEDTVKVVRFKIREEQRKGNWVGVIKNDNRPSFQDR